MKKIAIVRIRGSIGVNWEIRDTMSMIGLHTKNSVVILEPTPSYVGMVKKIKDYATWGELDDATEKLLLKKGKLRLNPPRGGYGRKGIKKPFSVGGGLGYRGDKINDLLRRMLQDGSEQA